MPPEVAVALCAKIGAHPHFVTPAMAVDTDYNTRLATYVKANGPSWMVPRFEGPNETWNFNFFCTHYARSFSGTVGIYRFEQLLWSLDIQDRY